MSGDSTAQVLFATLLVVAALATVLTVLRHRERTKFKAQATPNNSFHVRRYALVQLLRLTHGKEHKKTRAALVQLLHNQVEHLDYAQDPRAFLEYDAFCTSVNGDPDLHKHGIRMNKPAGWDEAYDRHHPGAHQANASAIAVLNQAEPDLAVARQLLLMHIAGTAQLESVLAAKLYELVPEL